MLCVECHRMTLIDTFMQNPTADFQGCLTVRMCLSHSFVPRTTSSSYAEHMNRSCPGTGPSARGGEGTRD